MSPKCFDHGPYSFFFFSNEGSEPPHVHALRDRRTAKLWLNPVRLARSRGFAAHELTRIQEIVEEREAEIVEKWNEFYQR